MVEPTIEKTIVENNYPNIFICGASGSGKSTSIRNLPKDITAIINIEGKCLPFRGADHFKIYIPKDYNSTLNAIKLALKNDEIEIVVIESFTALHEQAYESFVRHNVNTRDAFSGWNAYNDAVRDVLELTKNTNKMIIFTGLDKSISNADSTLINSIDVQGQKLLGKIEKYFTIVLFTKVFKEDDKKKYCLQTNNGGENTSKSPMDMFDEEFIGNDLNEVAEVVKEYYDYILYKKDNHS